MSVAENKKLVQDAFAAWEGGDGTAFFRILADEVRWTVSGSSPVSATYTSKQEFLEKAVRPLSERLAGNIKPTLRNIIAEGDWVVVQWEGEATSKSGRPYNNSYCWVMRVRDGKVQEGTAYIDTALVAELFRS